MIRTNTGGLRVIKAGMLTTFQDLGRFGRQHLGIVPGGAMDTSAHCLANALVGNPSSLASLEMTLIGGQFECLSDCVIAVSGARMDSEWIAPDQATTRVFPWDRPVSVSAGTRLIFKQATHGARTYLAVAGGFGIEPVLGSYSTYLPANYGGWHGRALRSGDVLPLREPSAKPTSNWVPSWSAPSTSVLYLPHQGTGRVLTVHAMRGTHFSWFSEQSQRDIFEAAWTLTPESNRIGFRFTGPELVRERKGDILSGPTCLGTVQVPAGGQPIVLMADHQTSGGYAKILEVASADCSRLAQLRPGERVQFVDCTLEQAWQLRAEAREQLRLKTHAIANKLAEHNKERLT
jgi:antagonist of KipI